MPVICQHCNKEFSSQSSRSNHIKKYHTIIIVDDKPKVNNDKPNDKSRVNNDKPYDKPQNKPIVNIDIDDIHHEAIDSKYKCSKCNCSFVHYQSRWKHEKNVMKILIIN